MPNTPTAVLQISGGPDNGKTVDIREGVTSLGRAYDNDIVVDETAVSRRHAGIRNDSGGYWIEDLGSKNGTYVNSVPLEGEGQSLHNMDRIELGGIGAAVFLVFIETGATGSFDVPRQS